MTLIARIFMLVFCAALLNGCKSSPQPPITYSNPVQTDDDFAKGANRPPTPETLYRMSRMLEAQGKYDQAVTTLTTAIERYPNYLPAYCGLAELHVRKRRLNDAMVALDKAHQLAPDDAVILNNLGMVYMLQGQHENALDAFAQAAGKGPNNARYKANMALATGMMGRYDEALALYSQVLRPAYAHYNLSVIAEARNDMARANEEFAKASALEKSIKRKPRGEE